MGRTPMDHDASTRIAAAAERDPQSSTAHRDFAERAEAAADRNDYDDDDE